MPNILAAIIGVEAIAVMAGWIFKVDALTRIFPSGVNMAFPTAVMFFLSAAGIFLISKTRTSDYGLSNLLLSGIALFLFLINLTILSGTVVGVQTGMENLFIRPQDYESINKTIAGTPSFVTIFVFLLFGITCIVSLFSDPKRKNRIAFVGYPMIFVGIIAVVGYAFHFPAFSYTFNNATPPMALNTALSFILLGISLVILGNNLKIHEA